MLRQVNKNFLFLVSGTAPFPRYNSQNGETGRFLFPSTAVLPKEVRPILIYLQMIESEQERSKFERLHEKYKRLMFHVADQVLHNEHDAEDAVHEAFVSILRNMQKISDVECPETRSYVVIITERKAIDILRARQRFSALELNEDVCGLEIPLPGDGGLADAMARLPARYREALLLRYDNGYSTKEIAQILNMKRDSVQKLLWRAKNALQKGLEQEDDRYE